MLSLGHRLSQTLPGARKPTGRCCAPVMATLTAGQGPSGSRTKTGSTKRPGQELERTAAPAFMAPPAGYSADEAPVTPVPLKFVVREAVKRWFDDTYQEATRGDVKQQALLGQMYAEGYGCEKDTKAAKEWTDRASARGYRMQGVYCEL